MSSPVVYAGPSIDRLDVLRLFPRAQVMPPIRRGDLSRDRALGVDVFLVLDGVFFETPAVSPREIIDVINDGAVVFGASSMGAIRAADCAPAGMRGIGTIYRQYRLGRLLSDDEVAVAFVPRRPYRATSVALINVRYGVSRAVRAGLLSDRNARRIVAAAAGMFFADRAWPAILDAAGLPSASVELLDFLAAQDLKRLDALLAVRALARWAERRRPVGRSRRATRTAAVAPAADREAASSRARPGRADAERLWAWLLATGEFRAYAHVVAGWAGEPSGRRRRQAAHRTAERREALASEALVQIDDHVWAAPTGVVRGSMMWALDRRRSSPERLAGLHARRERLAPLLCAELAAVGDLDAMGLRCLAIARAADLASRRKLEPGPSHWQAARMEIATNHGYRTWREFEAACGRQRAVWPMVTRACADLAFAKRLRADLFSSGQARDLGLSTRANPATEG